MHIYVYRITNLINQKEYVGVHTTSNLDDGYMGSGIAIMRAVKKHGVDNFRKEIIQFFDSESEAYDYESQIVNEEYVSREDTYNMTLGGKKPPARKGVKLDAETVERYRTLANTPERKQASAKGGRIGIRHVKENGWSQEAIAKRTKTRQERDGYSRDMSYCHTPEALARRTKSRYVKRLEKITKYYNKPVSMELIQQAKEEGVDNINLDTLLKYFTIDEIALLPYGERPAT